jgi:hypothetical protein
MTGILFKALPSLKARAANCRARARMFRERARSSPKDDLRTSLLQVAETYDALADGVDLKPAQAFVGRRASELASS